MHKSREYLSRFGSFDSRPVLLPCPQEIYGKPAPGPIEGLEVSKDGRPVGYAAQAPAGFPWVADGWMVFRDLEQVKAGVPLLDGIERREVACTALNT